MFLYINQFFLYDNTLIFLCFQKSTSFKNHINLGLFLVEGLLKYKIFLKEKKNKETFCCSLNHHDLLFLISEIYPELFWGQKSNP